MLTTLRCLVSLEARGSWSLFLWVARRRHGVPPGATAVSYAREQNPMMIAFLVAMVVEAVGIDLLVRALGWPGWLRVSILVVDLYAVLFVLMMTAACATRPHVVSGDEVRLRYGALLDVRVPRSVVGAVRRVRNLSEEGLVRVDGDELAVVVSSQTNLVLDLTEPVTVTRPLGKQATVRSIRFFADDPALALDALQATAPAP